MPTLVSHPDEVKVLSRRFVAGAAGSVCARRRKIKPLQISAMPIATSTIPKGRWYSESNISLVKDERCHRREYENDQAI